MIYVYSARYPRNYENFMKEYYLLCGPNYFCYKSNIPAEFQDVNVTSYEHLEICPKCMCDKTCITRGNCCPDVYFKYPELICANTTIIKGRETDEPDQWVMELMIKSCPTGSDETMRYNCENKTDVKSRILNFPVTRTNTYLTYFNKHCAQCHGEKDFDPWLLDISCDLFADFNFLSHVDDVIALAYERKCILQAYRQYDDNNTIQTPHCRSENQSVNIISKCNETGNWITYDANIEHACESEFYGAYGVFKNVFCYICNPPEYQQNGVIEQCNITGQWDASDVEMERACTELPESLSTRPYKNVFCYLCNRPKSRLTQFADVQGFITDEYIIKHDNFNYEYEFTIREYNMRYFLHHLNQIIYPYQYNEKEEGRNLSASDPYRHDTVHFGILCPKYLDFSHELLFQTLLDTAIKSKCKVKYKSLTKINLYVICDIMSENETCGGFPLRHHLGKSIEQSCKYLNRYFDIYNQSINQIYSASDYTIIKQSNGHITNIKCILCKSAILEQPSIEQCNWLNKSQSCTKVPRIYASFPFRNIYCILCQGIYSGCMTVSSDTFGSGVTVVIARGTSSAPMYPVLRNMFSIFVDENDPDGKIDGLCSDNQVYDFHTVRIAL